MNYLSACYSSDAVITLILNRHGLSLPSHSIFSSYYAALYTYREQAMAEKVKAIEAEKIVVVCGRNHVERLKEIIN